MLTGNQSKQQFLGEELGGSFSINNVQCWPTVSTRHKRATAVLFDIAGQHFTRCARKDPNINKITSHEKSVAGKSDGSIAGIKNLLPSQLLQVHVALNLPSNQPTSLV